MKACPRCGALNPEDHKFCGQCGQRLAESSTVAAQEATPAWPANTGVEDDGPDAAGDAPPWLAQLQAAAPAPEADVTRDDLPAWLREVESEAAAEPVSASLPAQTPSADLPDWLTIDDTPPPAAAEPESPPASLEDLPPWLQELSAPPPRSAAPAPSEAAEELPLWLLEDESPPEPDRAPDRPEEPLVDTAASPALPAWLLESNDAEQERSSGAPNEADQPDELPAWLRVEADDQPPAAAPVEPQPEPALPAWLLEEDSAASAAGESSQVPVPDWAGEPGEPIAAAPPPDELPPWLLDTDDEVASSVASLPAAGDTQALPAWLLEESPTAPPASEAVTAPVMDSAATQELPAWLLDEAPVSAKQPAAATPDEEELPAWLGAEPFETRPAAAPESPEVAAATQELPAWLLDETAAETSSAPAVEAVAPSGDDLPAWLRDESPDQPVAAAEPAPAVDELPRESSDLPAWLRDDAAAMAEPDAGQASDAERSPAESLPAWLIAEDESWSEPPGAPPEPAAGDLPAWLAEMDAAEPSAPAREPAEPDVEQLPPAESEAGTEQPAGDLPAWLTAADEPAIDAARAAEQSEDLPPWLAGIEDEPARAGSNHGLPAWLDEAEPAATPETATAQEDPLLGDLELPAWLREESATPPPPTVAEPAPAWLQSIAAESEEAPVAMATVATVAARPRIERTPERLESARLLERLRDEPLDEPAIERRAQSHSWVGPVMLILAVLAILAVIGVVLWGPGLRLNFGATPATPVATQNVAATIAALPAGRPVVVAYEWDARRLGDLRPLEDAVLGAIEARRDVPLVFVSTDPQGALLAEQRANRLLGSGDPYRASYGLGFANLGFKAGGPVALRRFAADAAFADLFARDAYGNDLAQNDVVMQAICGDGGVAACAWRNVGLLIVMADDLEDVRGWFEQLRSQHPALPALVLTTEEVAPQAQPYATLPETWMAAGLRDAAAVTQALGATDEQVMRRADAVAAGGALWGLLALIGAGPAYLAGRRVRRDAEDDPWP